MPFELMEVSGRQAVIKVLGIGGGGGNAVDHMLSASLDGVEFIVANTFFSKAWKSTMSSILIFSILEPELTGKN